MTETEPLSASLLKQLKKTRQSLENLRMITFEEMEIVDNCISKLEKFEERNI